MIDITKEQIDCALLRVENSLMKYISLQNDLKNTDISKDRAYQKRFNHYYRVRRNSSWQSQFYKILQEKKNEKITFSEALKNIHAKTGRYEASFASKLVATIHPDKPVIDKFVLENAGLKLPYSPSKDREKKIVYVYVQLQEKFQDLLAKENGKYLVEKFGAKFPNKNITKVKMVDLVLWQTR